MRTTIALALLFLLTACGGSALQDTAHTLGVAEDGGEVTDAGDAAVVDAGTIAELDAGPVAPSDAGTVVAAPSDAGPVVTAPAPAPAPAAGPTLGGCPMFPADNDWNRDISGDAVDAHSSEYVSFMGGGSVNLHPDFGSIYGLPYMIVPAGQPRVPMSFLFKADSDPGPYPFPKDLTIQNAADKHATVLSQGDCKLYETYFTSANGSGGFKADSGAIFDLRTGAPRPTGLTSATASGLPLLPGLARYDEVVENGAIHHALIFIAGETAHSFVSPATHSSGTSSATWAPPLGIRIRLRANFDLSPYSGETLVVLKALQHYGAFLIDTAGGQFWSIGGAKDSRWDNANLQQMKDVPTSAFDVVKTGPIQAGE
jgi:hypothetical protein